MKRPSFSWGRRRIEMDDTIDGVLVLRHGRPYDPAWDLWRPTRRWPGVLVSAVVTAGLLTAIAYHYDHRVAAAPKPVFKSSGSIPLQGSYFPPTTNAQAAVTTFKGTSSRYGLTFTSPGGLTTWTLQCRCFNNFYVEVRGADGAIVGVPVNATGPTATVAAADYPAGQYSIDVGADGPWTIQFIDEAGLALVKTPFAYLSSSVSVFGPFSPANHHLVAGYQSAVGQPFSVQVVDSANTVIDNAVYTSVSMLRNITVPVQSKPYYVVVSGAGLWLIEVK